MASRADGILSSFRENIYATIDMINFGRQAENAVLATIEIAKVAIPTIIATGISISGGGIISGCGMLYLSLAGGIGESTEAQKQSYAKYQEIIAKKTPEVSTEPINSDSIDRTISVPIAAAIDSEISPKQRSFLEKMLWSIGEILANVLFIEFIAAYSFRKLSIEFDKVKKFGIDPSDLQVNIAQTRVYLATLTQVYWSHMIRIGVLQLAIGTSSILVEVGCVAAKAGLLIATALGSILGITYILRGGALIYRSRKNRELTHELREQIKTIYSGGDDAQNKAKDIKALLDTYCTLTGKKIDFLQSMVAKNAHTNPQERKISIEQASTDYFDGITTEDELQRYVHILDQGLHKEIIAFEVGETLGWAMLLGGALTLVATFVSGGSSLPITTLIASIVFMYLEGTFALYDSSSWFDRYQRGLYETPGWLQQPHQAEVAEHSDSSMNENARLLQPENIAKVEESIWFRSITAVPRLVHYLYSPEWEAERKRWTGRSNKPLSTQTEN